MILQGLVCSRGAVTRIQDYLVYLFNSALELQISFVNTVFFEYYCALWQDSNTSWGQVRSNKDVRTISKSHESRIIAEQFTSLVFESPFELLKRCLERHLLRLKVDDSSCVVFNSS